MQYRHFPILLMVILLAGLASGESTANSMSLTGVVQDSSGALIVDAQVVLSTPDGKVVAQGVTDHSGNFHFSSVPPGNYSIFAQHPGFRDNRQQLKISSSMRPQLRIILPVAAVNEEVTVTGADTSTDVTADTTQNQNATVVDREALDRLPVFDQDYVLTLSRFLSSDATGTNGVSLVVNGIEANGPGVSASAIQSVKINQDPYSALYSRPGRARVEITTKVARQEFTGQAPSSTVTRSSMLRTVSRSPSRRSSAAILKDRLPARSVAIRRQVFWRR
jgi:hypothetical protein